MKEFESEIRTRRYGALITALPLSFASLLFAGVQRTNASAGADQYFEGTSVACVTVLGDTPVGIKSAHISFGVPSYGVNVYGADAPSFSVSYTLYNPTEKDETVSLAFPYELIGRGYGQDGQEGALEWNKETNCSICADGADLDYDLHYTYKTHDGFDVACMQKIQNVADEDSFFREDLPVYKYTYRITVAEECCGEPFVKLYLKGTPRTKIMREKGCKSAFVENAYRCLEYVVQEGGREITYYSIGGESEISCLKCDKTTALPSAELLEKSFVEFKDFVETFRPVDFLSQKDWYKASIDYFNDMEYKGVMLPSLDYGQDCMFVRWYLYDITVPAGGTKTHTVTAPLYPASSPSANRFRCQLSPLASFSSFGEITVEVKTPYVMSYSTLDFEQGDGVYSFRREELPFGDLSFVLSKTGDGNPVDSGEERFDPVILSIVILSLVIAVAVIAMAVLIVKNKHAQDERAEKETRARMGRPEEGKIDDDSSQNGKE